MRPELVEAILAADVDPTEPVVPAGDPSRHLDHDALVAGLRKLTSPRDRGRLALMVARDEAHGRATPTRVRLQAGLALPGDRWQPSPRSGLKSQFATMELGVAEVVCNGQSITLTGDNLIVDLDLSPENLPVGSLLAIGGARLVVTDKAHTGCKKFRQRFGRDALLLTAHPDWRHRRLRGLFLQVEQEGEVEVGDTIEVLRRGPEPGAEA